MTVEMLRSFFGWCTLFNWAIMLISLLFMTLIRRWTFRMHATMFGLSEEDVSKVLYLVMAGYKVGIFLFCMVPYLVLRLLT
jgi:hypothetical protein